MLILINVKGTLSTSKYTYKVLIIDKMVSSFFD